MTAIAQPVAELAHVRRRFLDLAIDVRPTKVAQLERNVDPHLADAPNIESLDAGISRLMALARAWATPTGKHHESQAVADAFTGTWRCCQRWLYPGCPFPGNWWSWQIWYPYQLGMAAVCTERLPITDFAPSLRHLVDAIWDFHPAANRMSAARSYLSYGLATHDVEFVDRALNWAVESTAIVTPGDDPQGFQADGSYFFHGAGVNLGYARSHMLTFAQMAWVLSGTRWAVPLDTIRVVSNCLTGFCRRVVFGAGIDPFVCGRGISHSDQQSSAILDAALLLHDLVDTSADSDALGELCAAMIADGAQPQLAVCERLAQVWKPSPPPTPAGVRYYKNAEYLAVDRGEYRASVKMASWRTKTYFGINKTNLKGWHISDGHLVLQTSPDAFHNGVLPAMDWERLTGITRADGFRTAAELMGQSWFVDGADDGVGRLACCGMSFVCRLLDRNELTARKSWFFLEDAIVATGSGIFCSQDVGVETIVRHVALPEPYQGALPQGKLRQMIISGHDCSYILPELPEVEVTLERRRGRFSDLRDNAVGIMPASETEYERAFWTARICHGHRPTDAGYVIVYLPHQSAAAAAAWWDARPFTISQRDSAGHQLIDHRSGTTLTVRNWAGASISSA